MSSQMHPQRSGCIARQTRLPGGHLEMKAGGKAPPPAGWPVSVRSKKENHPACGGCHSLYIGKHLAGEHSSPQTHWATALCYISAKAESDGVRSLNYCFCNVLGVPGAPRP